MRQASRDLPRTKGWPKIKFGAAALEASVRFAMRECVGAIKASRL
jgi:hypothetical protein